MTLKFCPLVFVVPDAVVPVQPHVFHSSQSDRGTTISLRGGCLLMLVFGALAGNASGRMHALVMTRVWGMRVTA